MAVVRIGIDRELEEDFRDLAQALGLKGVRSEPSSAAGGLELTMFDLHLSSQFAWGAILGWAVTRSKVFEIVRKGLRLQPSKEDLKQLATWVKGASDTLPSTKAKNTKQKVGKRKSVAKRKK